MEEGSRKLSAQEMAIVMSFDKQLCRNIGTICFRRCILTFDREMLTAAE